MKVESVHEILEKHRVKKGWSKVEMTLRLNRASTDRIFYPEMLSRKTTISLEQLKAIQKVTKIQFLN